MGKIQQIKNNCIPTIYSSFRHSLVEKKLFIESFLYKVNHIIFRLSFLKTLNVVNLFPPRCVISNLPELCIATCNTFLLKINLFYLFT